MALSILDVFHRQSGITLPVRHPVSHLIKTRLILGDPTTAMIGCWRFPPFFATCGGDVPDLQPRQPERPMIKCNRCGIYSMRTYALGFS